MAALYKGKAASKGPYEKKNTKLSRVVNLTTFIFQSCCKPKRSERGACTGGLLRLRIGSVLATNAITAKVPASMSNTDGPPKEAIRTPATAGPITKERLRLNDQSIFAASRSGSSTRWGRALRDPTSVAGSSMPAKKVSRKSSHSSSKPNQYKMGIRPMMKVRML